MKKLIMMMFLLPAVAWAQTFPVNNLQVNGNMVGAGGTAPVPITTGATISSPVSVTNLSATGTLALPANTVTNSFLAQSAAYTEKCNANSVTGNVSDCNYPNLNAEDFGVKGDNSTDNSAAMATALTACSNLGGCNLHFSTKTGALFKMHGVVVSSSSINFVCENGVILVNNSTNTYAVQFGNGSSQVFNQGIYNCTFGQATGVTPVSGNVGLSGNFVGGLRIHDVTAGSTPTALNQGISLFNVSQSFIDGVNVSNALATGVTLNGNAQAANDLYISNSHSDGNGADGWDITDYGGIFASNLTAFSNGTSGWSLFKTTSGNNNFFFTNCIGDTSGSSNWNITSLKTGVFTNAWGSSQKSTTVNTSATGFIFSSSNVADIQMINPVAINNNSHGIQIFNSGGMPQNITITNPMAGNNSNGNGKAAGGGYGIWVDNAASLVTVIGGEALNNTTGPVHLNGTSTTARISNLQGFNPQMGSVTQPGIPASGTPITNTTGVDCMVYIVNGTVTGINVGGAGVLTTTPAEVLVPANKTITLTYSVAPTWQWSGL